MAPIPLTVRDEGRKAVPDPLQPSDPTKPIPIPSGDLLAVHPRPSDISSLLPRSHPSSYEPNTNNALSSPPLDRRQVYISNLPATYAGLNSGPGSGTVVGIVLGVVLGYCLIFWLMVALINARRLAPTYVEGDDTEIVVRRGHDSKRSRRSHRSRSRREISEVSEVVPPPPRSERRRRSPTRSPVRERTERVIVEETIRRAESRHTSRPATVQTRSPIRETINVNIRESSRPARVEGDDMVEVIEEDTTSASAVTQEKVVKKKRTSGFRPVDPNAYGGGNYPRQEFSSRSRTRR